MLTQLFSDETGAAPDEVIVSTATVNVQDKDAPKGMKTHLDAYARALGRSAWAMSLKADALRARRCSPKLRARHCSRRASSPLSRSRKSGYPRAFNLRRFFESGRRKHHCSTARFAKSISRSATTSAMRTTKTKRRWHPNLKEVRASVSGGVKRMLVCTRCLRSGKVQKVA